jgi:hypothetical protein
LKSSGIRTEKNNFKDEIDDSNREKKVCLSYQIHLFLQQTSSNLKAFDGYEIIFLALWSFLLDKAYFYDPEIVFSEVYLNFLIIYLLFDFIT